MRRRRIAVMIEDTQKAKTNRNKLPDYGKEHKLYF